MILQKSPNEWSCFATAFAMGIGVPVAELLAKLPDGGEVVFPKQKDCKRFRGHHWMELQAIAYKLGWVTMTFEMEVWIGYNDEESIDVSDSCRKTFPLLFCVPVVIQGVTNIGNGHAVAYDPETRKYYDPRGHILDSCPLDSEMFFALFDLRTKEQEIIP